MPAPFVTVLVYLPAIDAVAPEVTERGEGAGMTAVGMANALFLALGRYQEAIPAAQMATFGMLDTMGAAAFAERARRELHATGETARKRTAGSRNDQLTAQEAQIARLARDGLSNPEIGVRLYLSAHTVQYHLRKVFAKFGITARSQLDVVLRDQRGTEPGTSRDGGA